MAQRTRQGLQRGTSQGTRQDILRGRPEQISSLETQFRSAQSNEERFEFLLEEVGNLWASLRGGGSSKKTRHPDMRLSQCLDQKGRVIGVYDATAGLITGEEINQKFLDVDEIQNTIWISPATMRGGSALATPPTEYFGGGGGRLMGWKVDTDPTTNAFIYASMNYNSNWTETPDPVYIVSTDIYYSLIDAPITGSVVRMTTAGFGYTSGDALTTPINEWTEPTNLDVSGDSVAYIYKTTVPETSINLSTADYIAIRLAMLRTNAAYTYTGSIVIHAMAINVAEDS